MSEPGNREPIKRTEENIVFVGGKPLIRYVTSVVIQFNTKNADKVVIKSRGKFISKAVDVAEVASKQFLKEQNISVEDIKIDSEGFENSDGKNINISIMEITLTKKKN